MKRPLLLLLGFCCLAATAAAQTPDSAGWFKSYKLGLNFTQSSFSSNWKAGGQNSVAFGSLFNGRANYRRNQFRWENELILEYGLLQAQGQSMRKTTDRIYLDSKVVPFSLSSAWSFFGAYNLTTQFDVGYSYGKDGSGNETRTAISRFFAPAFMSQSIGLEYKPNNWFKANFGLATLRETFVLDSALYRGADTYFGVPRGDKVRYEAGFLITADLNKDLNENLNLTAKFSAFGNYKVLNTVDTRLDVLVTARVWKRVTVTLSTTAMYFRDQDPGVQFAQQLGIGLLFDGKRDGWRAR